MSLSRCHHIFIPVEHTSDWPSILFSSSSADCRKWNRSSFFTSKSSSDTFHLCKNFIRGDIAHLCYISLTNKSELVFPVSPRVRIILDLRFCWILRTAVDLDFLIFRLGHYHASLSLQIEMLLTSDPGHS